MNWENLLSVGLPMIITGLLMAYLNNSARKEVEALANGQIELRMNKLYQIMGVICIAIVVVFMVAVVYYRDMEMIVLGLLMLLLFGGLGVPLWMVYQNHRLRFDDETISVINWLRKNKSIKWSEINQIKFSRQSGYIKISGVDKKLTIHHHMVGLKTFVQKMEMLTQWTARDLKLPI